MTEHAEQDLCPICQQERIHGKDLCWVCFATRERVVAEQSGSDSPSAGGSTIFTVLKQVAAALLVGVVGGVAAFAVLISMFRAFIGAVFSAMFEICTPGG
jgi:hypothetical protein